MNGQRRSIGGYDLEGEIGRGGMGEVHRAVHRESGLRVAIKLSLNPGWGIDKRFIQEAQLLERLRGCQNVLKYIERGEDNGVGYIVVELLKGDSLWKHLVARGGSLPETEAIEIMRQACIGVTWAHDHGVFHRDLKPDNLFVTTDLPGNMLIKVLDFGLAKDLTAPHMTQVGAGLGTPTYMAPEQRKGARSIDARAEVFALGLILIRMLAGKDIYPNGCEVGVVYPVFPKPTRVSQAIWEVAMRAANPERSHRQPSVREFWAQLQDASVAVVAPVVRLPQVQPTPAKAAAPKPQAVRSPKQAPKGRRRVMHRGVAIAAGVLTIFMSVIMLIRTEEEPSRQTHPTTQVPRPRRTAPPPATPVVHSDPLTLPPIEDPVAQVPAPPPPRPRPVVAPTPRTEPHREAPRRPPVAAVTRPLPPVVGARRSEDGRGYTIPAPNHWNDPEVAGSRGTTCAGLRHAGMERATGLTAIRFHAFCDGH